jgi:hypothetical protein
VVASGRDHRDYGPAAAALARALRSMGLGRFVRPAAGSAQAETRTGPASRACAGLYRGSISIARCGPIGLWGHGQPAEAGEHSELKRAMLLDARYSLPPQTRRKPPAHPDFRRGTSDERCLGLTARPLPAPFWRCVIPGGPSPFRHRSSSAVARNKSSPCPADELARRPVRRQRDH